MLWADVTAVERRARGDIVVADGSVLHAQRCDTLC